MIITVALTALALFTLGFRHWPEYRRERDLQLSLSRVAAIFPQTMVEASRMLARSYAETPYGNLFAKIAEARMHGLGQISADPAPTLVSQRAFTRRAVDSLHVYCAEDIRRGRRIPPLYVLPSPLFDSFSQPVTGDDGTPHTIAVINPLLIMTLTSYLSMYFVLIDRSCSATFRVDTMARFMGLTRALVLAAPDAIPRALHDIAFFHSLHVDEPQRQKASEQHGYRPDPHIRRLIQLAFRYIMDFMALHEIAHHFQLHIVNGHSVDEPLLAEPRILEFHNRNLDCDADRFACDRMLGYRPPGWEHDERQVDRPAFHFAIQFHLALLEYFNFVASLLGGCRQSRSPSHIERYLHLLPLLTGTVNDSVGIISDESRMTLHAQRQVSPVFREHHESLRAAIAQPRPSLIIAGA